MSLKEAMDPYEFVKANGAKGFKELLEKKKKKMNKELISSDLLEEWWDLNESKNSYAYGDESFDRNAFADLIKRTFATIKSFKEQMCETDFTAVCKPLGTEKNIMPLDVIAYSELIAGLSNYSADILIDESKDYIFTASIIITRFLVDYAICSCEVTPTDDTGELCAWPDDVDIHLPVGNEWNRCIYFDTNTGDFTEVIELAKQIHRRQSR